MHKLVTVAAAATFAFTLGAPVIASANPVPASASAVAASSDLRSSIETYLSSANLPAATKDRMRALAAKIPAGLTLTPKGAAAKALSNDWSAARDSAIDPTQYQCAETPLSTWLDNQIAAVNLPNLILLNNLGGLDIPQYVALLFGQASKADRFGYDGSYTNELQRTMRDLQGFWDIKSNDISLIPMHGAAAFANQALVSRTVQIVFEVDAATGDALAALYPILLGADPALKGGDHPIFTFNAFAFSAQGDPEVEALGITDRIIFGDGVLAGMKAVGLDRTAPRSILAHEFGHHVQYEDNLFVSPLPKPEATRRTELMADAFGAYFMTHKKGQAINKHLVVQDMASYYNVGDCQFTSDGHHGTPNQRMRSADWAGDLAAATKPASRILPSLEFAKLFDAKLPALVAPDAK